MVVVVLGLMFFGRVEHQNEQQEAAKHLVRSDQLDFMDMRMGPESYGSDLY